jgi:hypothetical protein
MPVPPRPIAFLETALLRRSVGAATARRERCHHCHRTPLVGELVHHYCDGGENQIVCDLCRPLRQHAPDRSGLMHSPEHERAVRVLGAVA